MSASTPGYSRPSAAGEPSGSRASQGRRRGATAGTAAASAAEGRAQSSSREPSSASSSCRELPEQARERKRRPRPRHPPPLRPLSRRGGGGETSSSSFRRRRRPLDSSSSKFVPRARRHHVGQKPREHGRGRCRCCRRCCRRRRRAPAPLAAAAASEALLLRFGPAAAGAEEGRSPLPPLRFCNADAPVPLFWPSFLSGMSMKGAAALREERAGATRFPSSLSVLSALSRCGGEERERPPPTSRRSPPRALRLPLTNTARFRILSPQSRPVFPLSPRVSRGPAMPRRATALLLLALVTTARVSENGARGGRILFFVLWPRFARARRAHPPRRIANQTAPLSTLGVSVGAPFRRDGRGGAGQSARGAPTLLFPRHVIPAPTMLFPTSADAPPPPPLSSRPLLPLLAPTTSPRSRMPWMKPRMPPRPARLPRWLPPKTHRTPACRRWRHPSCRPSRPHPPTRRRSRALSKPA